MTILVQSEGSLFKDTCANLKYGKAEKPVIVEIFSTLVFMMGVLLMGTAALNSKTVYLVGHALQAILLALYSKTDLDTRTVNRVTWEVKRVPKHLERRRDAYIWITEETTGNTEWLNMLNLADPGTFAYIQGKLDKHVESNTLCNSMLINRMWCGSSF